MVVAGIPIWARVVSFFIGYALGNILLGYILGKLSNVDIRTKGSGNVGTTNATRILGKKKGAVTLLCDVGKGLAAAGICYLMFKGYEEGARILTVYGAFGAVIGHDFPFYMGFKGGKGVATSLAFLLVVNPKVTLIAVLAFAVVAIVTRYISLASLSADITAVLLLYGFGGLSYFLYSFQIYKEACILVAIAAGLLVVRHKENIERLIMGEENKFSLGLNKKEN